MSTLHITQLNKTYANGKKALDNITLEINGGMFGLLGPNGAGKSSLMKTIAGLQIPDSGSIRFNGVDIIKDTNFLKKQLGFLPQDFGVYPNISAQDLLTHLAILKGLINPKERKEQVQNLLEKVNLHSFRHKEVHTFSGGMRQRFGIAQVLLGNPQLIIIDEPTAGLDPEERNRFNELLSEIGQNIIIILSTHLVEDVYNLCPDMAIINNGTVLAHGKPGDFTSDLAGKLYQKVIHKNDLQKYTAAYQVISTKFKMGKLHIHIQSDNDPGDGFTSIHPGLEDAYFSILNRKS